jgi:hypothetical protein
VSYVGARMSRGHSRNKDRELLALFYLELVKLDKWTICNKCTRLERYSMKVFLRR